MALKLSVPVTKRSTAKSNALVQKRRLFIASQTKNLFLPTTLKGKNLTMRMHTHRFTRLTNCFSKKIENHGYAIAAGLIKNFMSIKDIVNLVPEPISKKRGNYKKSRAAE